MWTQHNPTVPLGVIAMISKSYFWQIFNIIKFVFRPLLYLNPSTVHVIFNWYWTRTLIKFKGKIELVHEIDLVLTTYSAPADCKLQTKNSWTLSVCIHLNECAELLSKSLQENFQIYLEWSWQLMSLDCFFHQWYTNLKPSLRSFY